MIGMNVFKQDAFSALSMTAAIQDMETVPGFLRSLNLFTPTPIRTKDFFIEKRGQTLKIIPVTERGSAKSRRSKDRRNVRNFATVRLAEEDRILADELQGIRAFGSETELEAVQTEIARRQMLLDNDLSATIERHMLSAINGILLDADDTEIYDFYDEFGVVQGSEINFDWAAKTGVKKFIAENVKRPIIRALGGRATTGMEIVALCGDSFFDKLQENAEYRATYLQTEAARTLLQDNVFDEVRAWGVRWINYRGTDDNSTIAIASDKCKIFPRGVPNVFQAVYSPAEGFDFVNTLGLERYSMIVPDPTVANEYADLSVASYCLHLCTTPNALLQGNE
ncbi:hypothetical protein SZ64_04420 [Erythrobacter sp. SG61-1L]|uniref:major capsid protein n=1 Tax=Erythrobacter sp. SG61-1L TaxID=1603897 RepID=UPI0006C91452|nr:major capsid protein [Erythrobacter sp. SG61-1L]KPL67415.1 hypothetical protein SZ64_04420 [Erythrobacter sp. SG61-1L]